MPYARLLERQRHLYCRGHALLLRDRLDLGAVCARERFQRAQVLSLKFPRPSDLGRGILGCGQLRGQRRRLGRTSRSTLHGRAEGASDGGLDSLGHGRFHGCRDLASDDAGCSQRAAR